MWRPPAEERSLTGNRPVLTSTFLIVTLFASVSVLVSMATPVEAADRRAPRIIGASMQDVDGDKKADRLVLLYNERIKHRLDRDGRYPFKLTEPTYGIRRVNGASGTKKLVILLKEKSSRDATARPDVGYVRSKSRPVKDMAGNEARRQTFTLTVPLPCAPNAATDVYANPVVSRTATPKPTGVGSPSWCAFPTITSAMSALQAKGGVGRVIATGAGSGTATFGSETFPLSIPSGVTLTTSLDPELGGPGHDATKYVVRFRGTAAHAVALSGGRLRGLTISNARSADAAAMVVCGPGTSELDASLLDGAGTAGGQVNDGLLLQDGCTLSDAAPFAESIADAVRVRNFADTGVVVAAGSTLTLYATRIHNNGGDGLLVQGSAHLDLGTIAFNQDGIFADHSSTSTFSNLIIRDNRNNGVYIKTADVGFTSNAIFNNSRLDGWDEPQVLFDGPAPSEGSSIMLYWTGADCVPVNDFLGLHSDQCTVEDGPIDPPPDAWDCDSGHHEANQIHTYNTNTDPVGSSEFSVGMYAANGAFVFADNNSWRTGDESQNVDQDASSFVEADEICPPGGVLLQDANTSNEPVT